MKKLFVIMSAILLAVTLSACSKKGNFDVADGKYFAVGDAFENGYKYWVVVDVKDKKIKTVEWNAYHQDGGAGKCKGDDKYACSEAGVYGMNGEKGTWDQQAKKATDWIVKNQKVDVTFKEDGTTDAISTVSIHVNGLFDLVNKALESNAVVKGEYTDGYYYVESTHAADPKAYTYHAEKLDGTVLDDITGSFDSYTFGTFVVVNGTIVIADFNATQVAYQYKVDDNGKVITGTDKLKTVLVKDDGKPVASYVTKDVAGVWYGMDWLGQAKLVEAKLLADQTLNITVTDGSGVVEGVTGVSISHSVASMKEIFDSLVADAK